MFAVDDDYDTDIQRGYRTLYLYVCIIGCCLTGLLKLLRIFGLLINLQHAERERESKKQNSDDTVLLGKWPRDSSETRPLDKLL